MTAFDRKLPSVGTTIFTVMSRLANEHGAINLSQGFPDFDCDPALVEAVARPCARAQPVRADAGRAGLREAIAGEVRWPTRPRTIPPPSRRHLRRHRRRSSTRCRGRQPGDEVIVFEPCYDSYVPVIRLSGGMPVFVSLRYPDYAIDWDEVRRAITPRTRLIIVNTPHNPTGAMSRRRHARARRRSSTAPTSS